MGDFAELVTQVEEAPAPSVQVRVLLDPAAAAQHRQLEDELEQAMRHPGQAINARGPAQIAQDIRDLMDSAEPTTFEFAAVGARQWSDLIAKHPPSKKDREQHRDVASSFWPDAMAASCVTPEGADVQGFTTLWNKLSEGQWERLRSACREANLGTFDIRPSSAASVLLNGSRPKSEQPSA